MSAYEIDLKKPLAEIAADVTAGRVTAVELAKASLQRIAETTDYHTVLELNSAIVHPHDGFGASTLRTESPAFLNLNTPETDATCVVLPKS